MSMRLRYTHTCAGAKPTILYLHGFMGCKEDWDGIANRLGDAFSHLQVDLPGHGMTGNEPEEIAFSMPGCAQQLVTLLDSLRVGRCHVIGYSMGGRLALHLARYHPERFDKLVIESGSPGLRGAWERTQRVKQDRQLAQTIQSTPMVDFLKSWYDLPLFATIDKQSTAYGELIERRRRNDPSGLVRSLQGMGTGAQKSLWDDLPDIPNAMLLVAGDADAKFKEIAADMANLCPRGQLAILADAGHNVHLEQPERFCRHATEFLSPEE